MEGHSFCIVLIPSPKTMRKLSPFPQNFRIRKLGEITVFYAVLNTISRRLFLSRIQNNLQALGLEIVSPLFKINYVKIEKSTNFGIKENCQKKRKSFFLSLETWKRNSQTHCINRLLSNISKKCYQQKSLT